MSQLPIEQLPKRTPRPWLEAFWAGQAEALKLILSGLPVESVLEHISRWIEEMSDEGTLCSIFLANDEGTHLTLAAALRLPADFISAVRRLPVKDGVDSLGNWLACGEPVLSEANPTTTWPVAREQAISHGLKSCWSVPVISADGAWLGSMAYHRRDHLMPQAEDLAQAESAAKLVGLVIERGRAPEKNAHSKSTARPPRVGGGGMDLTGTLETIPEAFFTLNRDWRFTYVNQAAESMLRKSRGEILDRVIWETFPSVCGTAVEHTYRSVMEHGKPGVLDEFFHPPLGQWFEIRVLPADGGLAVYFRDVTAQRQPREQLRLLEACVARINDLVIITNAGEVDEPGPRILFVNDAFTRITGYSREEAIGRSPRFLQGPKSPRSELDRIRLALKRCEPVRAELLNYKKNGDELWLEVDIVPVAGANGRAAYQVGVMRDATERKRAEEEARITEERYVRQRNALITLTDLSPETADSDESAFQRITETHARALGVSRVGIWRYNADRSAIHCVDLYDQDAHRHISGMLLTAETCPAYFQAMEEADVIAADQAQSDPRTCDFAESYLDPLGITSVLGAPIHLVGGIDGILSSEHVGPPRTWTGDEKTFAAAVANIVSLTLEGSERQRAEDSVRETRKRFEVVARATNDAVWDWDFSTNEIWWNEGFETMFGFKRSEVEPSAESWYHRIHPADARRVLPGLRHTITQGGDHWSDEYRFQCADGSYAYVLDRGFVIRDETGRAIRMVGGMTDLTSRKQWEQDLARLNRALHMLSASNEAVTRATDEQHLLEEICRLAVNTGGYRMAWVGYARDDADRTIEPMARAGAEEGYLDTIRLSWSEDCPTGKGPAGRTIRTGETVVCRDIAMESAFFHWLDEAHARGYRSVICLPLRDGDRVFGLLALYSSEIQQAASDEISLLRQLADDLAFGISTLRSRQEMRRTEDVVLKVAQAVSSGTGTEFFDLLTSNMIEALGAHGGHIARLNPEELSVTTLSLVMGGKREENVTYSLLGTPCANVREGRMCIFERGVQETFPDDHFLVVHGIHAYAGIPLLHRDGSVAGIMVVIFDKPLEETGLVQSTLQIFAARASAELDRQMADARIRDQASLLDRARDAILVRNLDHRISYWNKSAERLYGWTAEEVIGSSVETLLYRDTKDFRAACQTVIETGEWLGELQHFARDGRQLTVEGRWTLLYDENGKPRNILTINTDITEHRQLQQQFLRAQRLESIGTLAGGIAHDLNNVLAPISMSIELLNSEVTSDRGRELLATLAGSARRGADMVRQVLSFARGMEGRRLEVHARRLVSDVENIVRDTFPKDITLDIRVPRNVWTLQGDPTQLHQVLINLCVNARDAMPRGGSICISAENMDLDPKGAASEPGVKPGPYVRISVEDSGSGIPTQHLEKIFEPFFTTKEFGKGTGLGLPTSLAIIKSHGGFIRAASPPGRGARFDVFLPGLPGTGESALDQSDSPLPRGHGETILIADDEEFVRSITGRTLESFGYQVLLAAGGSEAVDLYREHGAEISAVITDMMMPGMDGASVIRALAALDPEVKIIASSGVTAHDARAREASDCVRHFLPKPCSAETLLKVLKRVVSDA
ncbi:PAS domain S-box protein [Luteolibacter flavescens]|uniref:histidine kinase n=1 Tax=Luteolibacter flavescens TaxID=1859460 RepID=A0ABT3FLV3_9BACT|nr:PAS domain S-box protein [Luteolibacter flavescens]MCW1884324.1 PAS domain S-box protein [Luteolibacter flavescens]